MEELKMSHPMYAPAEVLDRYYSLEVGWRTKEMKRTAEKHYLELMMRLLASNSTDVLQDFTFDEYLWGTVSAKSRAFTLGEFGDIADEKGGLVPVIDMINNRNRRNLDWWWDTKTESMKVSALRDIMEGEELTIRYHPRADNAYLAFQFGFVLDKNESATSAFMPMAKIPEEKCELLCQHVEADMKIIQVDAEGGGRETESATPPEILRLFVVVADEMCKCSCERCKKKLQDKTTFCGRRADAAASSVISGFSTICSECAEMIADPYVRSTLSWWKMPACQPCEAALTAACTPAVAAVDVSCLGCETEAEAFCQDVIRRLFSSMSALVEDHPPHAVPSGGASHSLFRSPANFSISTEGQETPVSNNTHCGTLPLRDREEEAAGGQIEVQTCSQASRPQS
uniref:SET domain-containing protein n=1 Tax=Chromera velia CCMP2878 TaxID=1169474 RepID=A0A0G4H1W6_9ALVE|eukprot:Cvel_24362.t1-p1 / transcript=Cvel_24362.t1 / gene=Cvel_24362 / organism=Chromera_velia_CCMP2878 / gene_product=hypothetical protein / transcript_product=hypothetical protein / location=Cvel_scaffold2622:14271-15464(+) / protein_length=398 / sequence_SO=supercontig / SO=protein_coding / is_pseudo=false